MNIHVFIMHETFVIDISLSTDIMTAVHKPENIYHSKQCKMGKGVICTASCCHKMEGLFIYIFITN